MCICMLTFHYILSCNDSGDIALEYRCNNMANISHNNNIAMGYMKPVKASIANNSIIVF